MNFAMNINEKLLEIQTRLKAPKNQFNEVDKYYYRNCEDILEAIKPLEREVGAITTLSDKVVLKGERYYVIATATFTDIVKNENGTFDSISVCASAREGEKQSGMADAQITGSTSSYARKYALNGLFAIDDTKDDDFSNKHDKEPINKKSTERLKTVSTNNHICRACGGKVTDAELKYSLENFGKPLCKVCQQKEKILK